jgi:hypothetical protein
VEEREVSRLILLSAWESQGRLVKRSQQDGLSQFGVRCITGRPVYYHTPALLPPLLLSLLPICSCCGQTRSAERREAIDPDLMLQLPVVLSCSILKLSRDIPKFPRKEFPNSFSLPNASVFISSSFSSCFLWSLALQEKRGGSEEVR